LHTLKLNVIFHLEKKKEYIERICSPIISLF
jgi:hypothetical protein